MNTIDISNFYHRFPLFQTPTVIGNCIVIIYLDDIIICTAVSDTHIVPQALLQHVD